MIISILFLGTIFMAFIKGEDKKNSKDNSGAGSAKFPKLINYTSDEVDKPVFVFEGVNYDELPPHLNKIHKDCYSDYHRCSRSLTQHSPICGYDIERMDYESFHSICEMMYTNCQRKNKKRTWMYYIGDGLRCEHWTRRVGINSVSHFIKKIRNSIYG